MFKSTPSILFLVVVLLAGCTVPAPPMASLTGSGNVVTQEVAITDFDRLDVSQGFEVDISQGDALSVIVRIDDNLVEHLQVVKDGSTLKIGLKPGTSYDLRSATLEADVSMPELTGLEQRSGSHVEIKDFESAIALDAKLSGGSHLTGDVEAGDATFDITGGSHVTLSGSARDLTVDADSGSHAKLADLVVVNAKVKASGGSHVTVKPSGKLDAVARGGSYVRYVGSPTLGTIDDDVSSTIKQE